MRRKKTECFRDYLPENKYFKNNTNNICPSGDITFLDRPSQPELYHFGKIVSYLFIINALQELHVSGYRADLIAGATTYLNKLIQFEMVSMKNIDSTGFVVDYKTNSTWYDFSATLVG